MKKKENIRIEEILKTLPKIRKQIRNQTARYASYGVYFSRENGIYPNIWASIKHFCEPLGLVDTTFRENPNLSDYLVSYKYWRKRLKSLEKNRIKNQLI